MDFVGVESGDMGVEGLEVRLEADALAGEVDGQTVQPDQVDALDLALGFGGGGKEGDVVELQAAHELGRLAAAGDEEADLAGVDFQRKAIGLEGTPEEVEV